MSMERISEDIEQSHVSSTSYTVLRNICRNVPSLRGKVFGNGVWNCA